MNTVTPSLRSKINASWIHTVLSFIERQMVFVLMIAALMAFSISYAYAKPTDVSIAQTPEEAPLTTNLIYPAGDVDGYSCIDFTSQPASGCFSAYDFGSFSRQDIAITSDGVITTTDNITYQYALELAQPLSADLWYVDGSAEEISINGKSSTDGIDLSGATTIKVRWENGGLKRISHIPGTTTTITVAPAVPSSLFVIPVVASVKVGGTLQLIAAGLDDSGNPVSITPVWTSGSPEIATITDGGLLTGIKAGPVTVTVTANNITASATITVMPPVTLQPIIVSPTPDTTDTTDTATETPVCPTGWVGTECGDGSLSPTDPNAPVVVTPTVPDTITQEETKQLLDDLAEAISQQVKTDSVAETVETTIDTLYSTDAIARRYELTGSIFPSLAERELAINAQPTASMRFAITVGLVSKAVLASIDTAINGRTIVDDNNQVIAQIPSLLNQVTTSIVNLWPGN